MSIWKSVNWNIDLEENGWKCFEILPRYLFREAAIDKDVRTFFRSLKL